MRWICSNMCLIRVWLCTGSLHVRSVHSAITLLHGGRLLLRIRCLLASSLCATVVNSIRRALSRACVVLLLLWPACVCCLPLSCLLTALLLRLQRRLLRCVRRNLLCVACVLRLRHTLPLVAL